MKHVMDGAAGSKPWEKCCQGNVIILGSYSRGATAAAYNGSSNSYAVSSHLFKHHFHNGPWRSFHFHPCLYPRTLRHGRIKDADRDVRQKVADARKG